MPLPGGQEGHAAHLPPLCALHLTQSGVDIAVVKDWLGHADVKTTHLYVDINVEMKREALEACPPPYAPRTDQPQRPR